MNDEGPHAPARAAVTRGIRAHGLAILAIAVVTAAISGPRWYLLLTDPPAGARVQVAPWASSDMGYDFALFARPVRDAYDGAASPARLFFSAEDVPTPPGGIWLQAIGSIGRPIGSPFWSLAIVTTLAMAAAMALLYIIALETGAGRSFAAAAIPLAAMFNGAIVVAGVLSSSDTDTLRAVLTADGARQFHAWYRFLPPALPLPVFFACVVAIPRAVVGGRRPWMIAASVALALLVYTYLFYWVAMAVALVLWCIWLAARREDTLLWRLLLIGVLAVVLASPEIVGRLRDALTLSADARARFGKDPLGFNRAELWNARDRALLVLPFVWFLWRDGERSRFVALLMAVPLPLDLISGIVPQTEHYVTQVWHVFALPGLIAGFAVLLRGATPARRRVASAAAVTLAVLAAVWVIAFQVRTTRAVQAQYAIPVDERAAFGWMEQNLGASDVVVSPSLNTNMLIASLTPASPYLADGFFTRLSDDEIIDRFLRAQAAFGVDEATVFDRLDPANGFPTSGRLMPPPNLERRVESTAAYYLFNYEITRPWRITQRLPAWRARYRQLLAVPVVLQPYPATHLFCGRRERSWRAARPPRDLYVTVAFRQGETTVYRIAAQDAAGAFLFRGC